MDILSHSRWQSLSVIKSRRCVSVTASDDIDCDRCKYHVRPKTIELTLKKKVAQKWGALEASQKRSECIDRSNNM